MASMIPCVEKEKETRRCTVFWLVTLHCVLRDSTGAMKSVMRLQEEKGHWKHSVLKIPTIENGRMMM